MTAENSLVVCAECLFFVMFSVFVTYFTLIFTILVKLFSNSSTLHFYEFGYCKSRSDLVS